MPSDGNGRQTEWNLLEGKVKEIADYCETDIINTYRLGLRYELFRAALAPTQFHASEEKLAEYIKLRSNIKPHLDGMIEARSQ